MDMPGPTEDLKGEVLHPVSLDSGELSDPKENMGVAAYMVRSIALWGRIINYLNLGGRGARFFACLAPGVRLCCSPKGNRYI